VEDGLRRVEEAEPIRPAVIVGAAVGILLRELEPIGRVLGGARAALVLAVLAHEEAALEDVILGSETDAVRVAVAPREGLDRYLRVLGVELGAQDRPVADAGAGCAVE